jgi:AraC-like DNA-binding protein
LLSDELSLDVQEEGDRATVRLSSMPGAPSRLRVFITEMEAVGIVRLMRYFGSQVRPERVSFAYSAPAHRAEYTRIFQGLECFDQAFSGVSFPRRLMDAVPPHRDGDVRSALQAIAARRVLRMAKRTPYSVRVRDQLVAQGPCVRADMSQVAHALGLSVRSLRRRLEAEGETFNAVANEAAAIIAKQLLEDKQRTIQEAAYEMGFADASGFHRAFKRWTGQTPRGYLEGKLPEHDDKHPESR